jgi:hypothetical protein
MFFIVACFFGLTACMDTTYSPSQGGAVDPNPGLLNTELVDTEYIGAYPSLAVAPDGRLHASYYAKFDWGEDGGGSLRHAILQDGSWTVETVDGSVYETSSDIGRFTSIRADSLGGLHVAYWDVGNKDLKYATLPPGQGQSWQIEIVVDADEVCGASDLKLDSLDKVSIGYCKGGKAWLASKVGGEWMVEEIADVGDDSRARVAIQVGSDDSIHAVVFTAVEEKIKYTVKTVMGWQPTEEVSSALLGDHEVRLAFVLDGGDIPNVVFYDIANQELVHAVRSNGDWQEQVIATIGNVNYEESDYVDVSALVDQIGRVRVSYFDGTNQDLKHALLEDAGWTYETIDDAGDVGRTSAMAVDSNGWIHIIYRDSSNNDLRYAYLQ